MRDTKRALLLFGFSMLAAGVVILYQTRRTSTPAQTVTPGNIRASCNRLVMTVDREKACDPTLYSNGCIAGHVKHFKPVCGRGGCLRHLPPKPKARYYKKVPRKYVALLDKKSGVYRKWNFIQGWIHASVHVPLITYLTDMQWYYGIYGSVGEIGVYKGKLTSVLALNMDTAAGERLFIADIFEKKTKLQTEVGRYNIFLQSMKKWGFSVNFTNPEKTLHIWWDSSVYLRKEVLARWNIPSVRIMSVDGGHSYPVVMNDFIKAVCLIRHGGIIVFDDFPPDKRYKSVEYAIKDFFSIFGTDVVVPIVMTGMKLYVCTKDKAATYRAYIGKYIAPKLGLVAETSTRITGNTQTYYVSRKKIKRIS